MCGIIAVFHYGENKEPANDVAINMMQDQIKRGQEGFGAIYIDNKHKFVVKRATQQLKALVDNQFNPSQLIIMHHRMPSASANTISQTHPIVVDNGSLKYGYLVIHNGIVRNDDELKKQHEEEGFIYTTDDQKDGRYNDSECVAIEMAKYIEKQTKEIAFQGSCAFIALQYDKKTNEALQIYYGKNLTNPLKLAKSRNFLYLSSEGKGEDIKEDTLYSFNLTDFKICKREMKFADAKTTITQTTSYPASKYNNDDDYCGYTKPKEIGFVVKSDKPNIDTTKDKDEKDEPTTEFELADKIDENHSIIESSLSDLYLAMEEEENIWKIDIDKEIRYLVVVMMRETRLAYQQATEFFAQKVVNDVESGKITRENMDEPEKEIEKPKAQNKTLPAIMEKYCSR